MVAEIVTGFGALKSAYEIAKGLKDINDQVRLNNAVIELQSQILTAQAAVAEAKDRMQEMQKVIDEFDNWSEVSRRYQLKHFGCQTYAYEAKVEYSLLDPIHLACPNCFQSRRISILQLEHTTAGGRKFMKCHSCDRGIYLGCHRSSREARLSPESSGF